MTIILQYKTESGDLYDSLEAAQIAESLASESPIYVESYKLRAIIERILRDFIVYKRTETIENSDETN